ncbi:MAG TPA: tetratricopeptide repeat protein [Xanthobacteraceae bacterium]|jgi:Flp pilus assembly protein TadD
MPTAAGRLLVATACLLLTGCETSVKLGDVFQHKTESAQPLPPSAEADTTTTGTVRPPDDFAPDAVPKGLLGNDPNDDLSLGKKYFRAADFGLAERHFRKAVELHPRDLESWIGLAAAYDRLRRFDLADRAYAQAMKIAGATPEILNNVGYSYMLRGDYRRARDTLLQAQAQDPGNPYIRNNLELLEASFRKGKAIQ